MKGSLVDTKYRAIPLRLPIPVSQFLMSSLLISMAAADSPTIQDVRDAVLQARFRRATLSYKGTFREIRHAEILEEHNQQRIERDLQDGSITEDEVPRLSNIMLDNSEQSFRFWETDAGRFRFEADGSISVYDGELYRRFDPEDKNGRLLRTSRRSALTNRNTIDTFLETRGAFLLEVLSAENVTWEIAMSERNFPGTSTVLHVRGAKGAEPTLFTDLFLDTERNYWPLEIDSYSIWIEPDGSKTRYNDTKLVISDFHCIDGCFVPASLHKSRYLHLFKDGPGVDVVGIEETLHVTDVEVNQPIDDQMFTIEFPPGTQFLNSDDGLTYLVDADGTVKEFSEQISAPESTDAPRRWLLVIVNLLALAVIALWLLLRRK